MQKPYPGKFIVFEGIDGAGKTTQSELLFDFLRQKKQKAILEHQGVHLTQEPTTNLIGGLIRSQLTHDWKSGPECLQLLFAADRMYHLAKEILPCLQKGMTVISDRYLYSSIAFGTVHGCKNNGYLQSMRMPLCQMLFFSLMFREKFLFSRNKLQ